MDVIKYALWQCEFVKWSNGVIVNFCRLIRSAGSYPSSDIFLNAIPHKELHNELLCGFNSKICQVMQTRQCSNFGMIGGRERMDTSHNRMRLKPSIVMSWR